MNIHSRMVALGMVAVASLPGLAGAQDAANGKVLLEKNCYVCHGSEMYTRTNRKVTSMAKLEAQVRRCDSGLELGWFDDDIADVVHHLNQSFYHFNLNP